MITILYITSLVLLTLRLASCQLYSNIEKDSVVEKILNDTPISFGIKSFTIEITKPTVKPTELNSTENVKNKIVDINLNKNSNFANISNKNALAYSTESIEWVNFPNESNKSITQLENTGERPPSAKLIEKRLPHEYVTENINDLQASKIMSTNPDSTTEDSTSNSNSVQKNDNLKPNELLKNPFKDDEFLGKVQQNKLNKMNIIDLYPSEVQDFAQTTVKVEQNLKNDDKNKLTNSLNELFDSDDDNVSTSKIEIELIDEDNKNVVKDFSETDLTGKLQERDGIITDIEKKFRLDDLLQVTQKPIQIDQRNSDLIDRRVKKSFIKLPNKNPEKETERIGIGNTKFNTNVNDQKTDSAHSEGREDLSTTKFYNSKELYNEMLQRKLFSKVHSNLRTDSIASNQVSSLTTSEIITSTVKTPTISSISTEGTTKISPIQESGFKKNEIFIQNTTPFPSSSSSVQTSNSYKLSTEISGKTEAINTGNTLNTEEIFYSSPGNHVDTRVTQNWENLNSPAVGTVMPTTLQEQTGSTSVKPSMPSFRAHILTRLQQKINALECDIQNVSPDSKIWRGNETHELLLPVTAVENCTQPENCKTKIKTWEGQTEIQSGDVLIVEINDSLLGQDDHANIVHKPTTQVYQVTRPGYEHCDVTEGVLLDITPLVVDDKKLVTLYDKDLTEGINLLIVVSELWGNQCVRLKVTVKSDNCGENADCSTKGVCFSNDSMEGYECQCCTGFAGSHCEEIDACSPSPCTNNGICVDLSQGHEGNAYQCLCPYGYTGKNCQYESDPCNPAECLNGATCTGNSTHFTCHCAPGYTGPLCQHNLNECESSPCVHGICVDQESGFRCFCQPGFSGELCNFEYNECESNPCLNDAQCVDQIGGFDCKCTKGYTGSRCHIKVDFCASNPCPEGHTCIDHGNYFSCECPRGRNGPDCNQIPRIQCSVNTCANGGTCWSRSDSFYCACRPGYTGKMCEDEFVVETVVSSSEFMVDDTRNFNEKPFGVNPIKSPIELHNAYIAAGTLAAAIFIVAIVVTVCHCKVNQTYRRFSNRQTAFIPIFGFGKRVKSPKSHRHWLSGKRILGNSGGNTQYQNPYSSGNGQLHQQISQPIHERSFQRQLALNLENDMYYTVDFSESQNSPLMQ